jgi:hypothetical protein
MMVRAALFSVFLLFVPSHSYSEVLFEEKFEDTNFTSRGWYDAPSGTLASTEHIDGSTRSFECEYLKGQQTCAGGTPGRHKFPETDIVYLSYYVKYSINWEGSNRPYHPHEFYFVTNVDSDWIGPAKTHLTVYIEQNEGTPVIALQDSLNVDKNCILRNDETFAGCNGDFDSYSFSENRSVASCNGIVGYLDVRDCYYTGSYWYSYRAWDAEHIYFRDEAGPCYKNDWHRIEAMFEMNSIQDGKGIPDGKLRYWMDGQLLISSDNTLFRTGANPNMRFNQLILGPYIGDGSPVDQIMWLDDLTVSTHRLPGSLAESPPSGPANLRIIH